MDGENNIKVAVVQSHLGIPHAATELCERGEGDLFDHCPLRPYLHGANVVGLLHIEGGTNAVSLRSDSASLSVTPVAACALTRCWSRFP